MCPLTLKKISSTPLKMCDWSLRGCVCKMCSESNNCFQHKSIMSSYICAFNANHTFESLACTQGIHLLHFYYPSHSIIMLKVWKLNLKKLLYIQSQNTLHEPAAPIQNKLKMATWHYLSNSMPMFAWFFSLNYCMWQAQRNSEKKKKE